MIIGMNKINHRQELQEVRIMDKIEILTSKFFIPNKLTLIHIPCDCFLRKSSGEMTYLYPVK